ncbi:MAG TPA: DEAD/DEAH box helicase [Opitutaceae bacterium]
MAESPKLATFPKLAPGGTPATLRIVLPPTLAAAAARDAIPVRLEIDVKGRGRIPAGMLPESSALDVPSLQLSVAFLVESWNGGKAATFAQLTREQLRALLAVGEGEPMFFLANRPNEVLAWNGRVLGGVSDKLTDPEPAPPAPPARPASPARPTSPAKVRPAARREGASNATPPLVDGSEHFLAIQLPAREHIAYEPLLELVKSEGFRLEPSNRKWWLRDRHHTLNFLARHWSSLEKVWFAEFTENFRRNTAKLSYADVDCDVSEAGEDFEVTLAVRAGDASEREVHDSLATGRTYVESAGKLFLFDSARLEKLHAAQKALGGSAAVPLLGRSRHKIARPRIAEIDALLNEISPNVRAPDEWRRRSEAFRNLSSLQPAPAEPALNSLLRPYQRLGAAWLWHLRQSGLSGILADEMGLGKTLQALALITAIKRNGREAGPCLVVCPASLVENWRREAARFAPDLRVRAHHGSDRDDDARVLRGSDLVITSYGILARDQALIQSIRWDTLVADEAQHVKNRRTQNAQALQSIPAPGRILLTGTPVENSLADLESLFAVILPGYLQPIPGDARGEDRSWHEARFRRQSAPYILRRTKAQVTPELPEKIQQTVYIELTAAQRALYETVRASTEQELMKLEMAGQSEGRIRMAIFTQLLRLRQVCGDPRLLDQSRDPAESAKLAALNELLEEAIDDGHRVLVFSQFTSMLGLVRKELEAQGVGYCYLDGSMPARARQSEIDRFNAGGQELPVFLLSLKAGGTGLNLATADTVVHFDPWWNPAVEAQATDRAHRIGQTRVVTSYKLIASDTIEERVLNLQNEKRVLLERVFDESDAANAALTLADLRTLLQR